MNFLTAGSLFWCRIAICAALAAPLMFQPVAVVPVAHAEGTGLDQLLSNITGRKNKQSQTATTNFGHGGQYESNGSKVNTTTEVVWDRNIQPMLKEGAGEALRAAEGRYRDAVAAGGFPKVSRSVLKKGTKGAAVVALNKRLFMEGYLRVEATEGEFASIFTSATDDALRRFQYNMGIAVTGKTDSPTVDALNVTADARLRTIEANIAREDLYAQNLGDRYVIVNVPAQQIQTVQGGRVYSQHNAIVGRISRPSPVVITSLSDINFNPYWNAPVSIVEQDIIPKLVSGGNILTDMNIKVFKGYGGPEVDPHSVSWRSARPDDYYFRQEPGPENAMATAKINFSSPFGIYMHDTPEKQLFKGSPRFYSSGCVRVENMSLMVQWVLNGQDGIGADQIATLAETLERKDVKLIDPPQLRVVYMTAWPTSGGTVAFRNDVYELDGTGFTVGQPMPVGERSPDGQRYVLKPLPRLVAEVDDGGGSGGIFGFGRRSTTKSPSGTVKRGSFFDNMGGGTPSSGAKTGAKTVQKAAVNPPFGKVSQANTAKAKATAKKPSHGLFDFFGSSQASSSKTTKPKVAAKKTAKPSTKTATAKTGTSAKTAAATGKKPVVAAKDAKIAKSAAGGDAKTVVASKDVKVVKPDTKVDTAKTTVASAAGDAPKLKVVKPALKPAASCVAGKDGKLPAGCKPVTASN
jgi:L,D-transpeptidase YcbB